MYRPLHLRTLTSLTRSLHVSSVSRHLVGPNDPISNLRPIIYTDSHTPAASHSQGQLESHVNHPYSLNEFTDVPHDHTLELQHKLAREQFDAFNHNFWTDVRRRQPPVGYVPHGYNTLEQLSIRNSQTIRLGVSSRVCLSRNARKCTLRVLQKMGDAGKNKAGRIRHRMAKA